MRNDFPEYYPPSDDETHTMWDEGLVLLDANVLLNFHRQRESTRSEYFSVLRLLGDRLRVPRQAALEYHRHRLEETQKQFKQFDDALRTLASVEGTVKGDLGKLRHETEFAHEAIDQVIEGIDRARETVQRRQKEYTDRVGENILTAQDDIFFAITDLLDGKVLPGHDDAVRAKLIGEARSRYTRKQPPGYKDADKDDERAAGDFLIWMEAIELAKQAQKPVMIVTNDRKEDWWLIFGGKIGGPRPELVREFLDETGQRFHLTSSDSFLREAAVRLPARISEDSIQDVVESAFDVPDVESSDAESREEARVPEVYRSMGTPVSSVGEALKQFGASQYPAELGSMLAGQGAAQAYGLNETLAQMASPVSPLKDIVNQSLGLSIVDGLRKAASFDIIDQVRKTTLDMNGIYDRLVNPYRDIDLSSMGIYSSPSRPAGSASPAKQHSQAGGEGLGEAELPNDSDSEVGTSHGDDHTEDTETSSSPQR